MTNLQIAALAQPSMVTQLLTADGGEWEVSKHLQEIMALAADGTLYLSESHQNDIHVLSFIDRLDRRGFRYQLNLTDLQTIHQLYRAVAMDGLVDSDGQRATQMQERVVKIIRKATELRASDVHFVVSPAGTGSKIRFRVDGLLKTVEQFRSQELHELCATIYQSMCDVAEPLFKPQLDQDARMSQTFVEKLNLFGARIATRPRAGGFLMILRLLYDDTGLDSLEQLGYLPEQNALFDRMMRMPYGINILSGPTGSGKSMTLKVTMEGLDKLHGGSKHILTIEDPPEYRIRGEGINQTPLVYDATDPDAERQAWAAGIANGMRLDPDYMMIGEVRDLFAAVAAFRGAMTGHGLWSTLHTNSAIGIVQRLKDLGVDPGLLFDPALLTGLINQSLLPKLCPRCKLRFQDHQDQLAPDLVERARRLTDVSQVHVKGPGCQACRGSGVNGRSIVAEVVLPTLAFMRVFAKGGPAEARNYWVKTMQGITKHAHAIRRINEGIFDPQMVEDFIGPLDFDEHLLDDSFYSQEAC
ncbi:GspE/PulE family protein [Pseudomonas aeruginosa]|uniref:GspE/PulE family protein n=1 Tax=Pseudomonas aeruginosa TaxID=287 RepID=UPI003FD6B4EA